MSKKRKSKRKKKPNPVLKEKYDQGFKDGVYHAVCVFGEKFNGLDQVEGIGEKTMYKIKMHLGERYFKG